MNIAERLASLRETTNTSLTSELESTPTPFSIFLSIYNKAGHDCFINYMEGAKAVYKWLSPIDIPDIPNHLLPKNIPGIVCNYTVEKISHLFYPLSLVQKDGMDTKEWFSKINYIQKLVVYFTCKEIIHENY